MERIRIQRKITFRGDRGRYAVLPLDPRDPDIARAKVLLNRGSYRPNRIGRRA
jgi:hypothetical protein